VRRGRPRDPELDEVILDAAVDLLGEVGYARLTMDLIARRAGVSKASLYLRWPSKIPLVAQAVRHRTGIVPEIPNTGSLPGDMRAFLQALLSAKRGGERAVSAISGEVNSNPELREAWRRGLAGTLVASIQTIVARAVDRGEIAATSDVELLSVLPLAVLQQWRLVRDEPPDAVTIDRIVAQFYTPDAARAGVCEPREGVDGAASTWCERRG
jgi:AcrR family transcriptional regulator